MAIVRAHRERHILKNETTVVALLPMVVCDPEKAIASSAALSLISNSMVTEEGRPYGLLELEPLLRNRTLRIWALRSVV